MWKEGTGEMPKSSSRSEEVLPGPAIEKEGNFLTLPNWALRMGRAGSEERTEVKENKQPTSEDELKEVMEDPKVTEVHELSWKTWRNKTAGTRRRMWRGS